MKIAGGECAIEGRDYAVRREELEEGARRTCPLLPAPGFLRSLTCCSASLTDAAISGPSDRHRHLRPRVHKRVCVLRALQNIIQM